MFQRVDADQFMHPLHFRRVELKIVNVATGGMVVEVEGEVSDVRQLCECREGEGPCFRTSMVAGVLEDMEGELDAPDVWADMRCTIRHEGYDCAHCRRKGKRLFRRKCMLPPAEVDD